MEMLKKVFSGEVKAIDEKEMTLTASVSTKAVDRMGDIVDPKGVDFKNFNRNPVVLFAHDYESPPIAKALWIKRSGDTIVSKMKFADTEFAREIFAMYKDSFMRAFSIGFMAKAHERIEDKEGKFTGFNFTKTELLEFSAVPVPANPEALALAMQKGILKDESLIEKMQKEFDDDEQKEDEKTNESSTEHVSKETVTVNIKTEESGLEDIVAENKQLQERIKNLEIEICEAQYEIYKMLNQYQKSLSEIADGNLADNVSEAVTGAIRKALGKMD